MLKKEAVEQLCLRVFKKEAVEWRRTGVEEGSC